MTIYGRSPTETHTEIHPEETVSSHRSLNMTVIEKFERIYGCSVSVLRHKEKVFEKKMKLWESFTALFIALVILVPLYIIAVQDLPQHETVYRVLLSLLVSCTLGAVFVKFFRPVYGSKEEQSAFGVYQQIRKVMFMLGITDSGYLEVFEKQVNLKIQEYVSVIKAGKLIVVMPTEEESKVIAHLQDAVTLVFLLRLLGTEKHFKEHDMFQELRSSSAIRSFYMEIFE